MVTPRSGGAGGPKRVVSSAPLSASGGRDVRAKGRTARPDRPTLTATDFRSQSVVGRRRRGVRALLPVGQRAPLSLLSLRCLYIKEGTHPTEYTRYS